MQSTKYSTQVRHLPKLWGNSNDAFCQKCVRLRTTNISQKIIMTAAAAAPKSPKKASKPKAKPTHPPTAAMVMAAVKALKDAKGSSLPAIKKYIAANYKVDFVKLSPFVRKALKSLVEKKKLVQTKGTGASGSFKLNKAAKEDKPKKAKKPKAKKPKAKKPAGNVLRSLKGPKLDLETK